MTWTQDPDTTDVEHWYVRGVWHRHSDQVRLDDEAVASLIVARGLGLAKVCMFVCVCTYVVFVCLRVCVFVCLCICVFLCVLGTEFCGG